MAHQHQRFHTDGSNALKAEPAGFDVFVRPSLITDRSDASIIDFDRAQKKLSGTTNATTLEARPSLVQGKAPSPLQRCARAIKKDRLFSPLFATKRKNAYRIEDLVVFAKGFSITGAATFILILFGA